MSWRNCLTLTFARCRTMNSPQHTTQPTPVRLSSRLTCSTREGRGFASGHRTTIWRRRARLVFYCTFHILRLRPPPGRTRRNADLLQTTRGNETLPLRAHARAGLAATDGRLEP